MGREVSLVGGVDLVPKGHNGVKRIIALLAVPIKVVFFSPRYMQLTSLFIYRNTFVSLVMEEQRRRYLFI